MLSLRCNKRARLFRCLTGVDSLTQNGSALSDAKRNTITSFSVHMTSGFKRNSDDSTLYTTNQDQNTSEERSLSLCILSFNFPFSLSLPSNFSVLAFLYRCIYNSPTPLYLSFQLCSSQSVVCISYSTHAHVRLCHGRARLVSYLTDLSYGKEIKCFIIF